MSDAPEKTGKKQERGRFMPGTSGNPQGRPRGARNATTRAIETLLQGQAEALTQAAIDQALAGDTVALRLCLERLCPPRKERCLEPIDLPEVSTVQDLPRLTDAVLKALAQGELLPSEAQALASLVAAHAKALAANNGTLQENIPTLNIIISEPAPEQ